MTIRIFLFQVKLAKVVGWATDSLVVEAATWVQDAVFGAVEIMLKICGEGRGVPIVLCGPVLRSQRQRFDSHSLSAWLRNVPFSVLFLVPFLISKQGYFVARSSAMILLTVLGGMSNRSASPAWVYSRVAYRANKLCSCSSVRLSLRPRVLTWKVSGATGLSFF